MTAHRAAWALAATVYRALAFVADGHEAHTLHRCGTPENP